MSIELYPVIYILIALVVAVFSRIKVLDGYGELYLAGLYGIFWPVVVPSILFLGIVETTVTIIEGFKEKSK